MTQTWLVTGANSGAGLAVTKEVLSLGHDVVAAIRSPDTMSDLSTQYPNQLATVKCDVTSQTDVDATFASITQKFGRLDVVWNNAGYSVAGEIEAVEVDDVKALFEVNVWGALRVSKAAVRYFREVNRPAGGRLIQASSLMGLVALPGVGYYASSKWTLEAISEALASELDPNWNIKVSIVEMGQFRTNFGTNAKVFSHPAYESDPSLPSVQFRRRITTMGPNGSKGDPAKLAKKIVQLSNLENPPLRVIIGENVQKIAQQKWDRDAKEREQYTSWSDDVTFDE